MCVQGLPLPQAVKKKPNVRCVFSASDHEPPAAAVDWQLRTRGDFDTTPRLPGQCLHSRTSDGGYWLGHS